jgi:glycerol-3-phosphate dehydrogenase
MSGPLDPNSAVPLIASRSSLLARLRAEEFDLLIVGGGITGSGVARDAALRGLRVALVEADDFASGTSSRSSRLVHGGVRYLEHGYLHLVFEASRERRTLLRIAPHLVRPLPFTWPVYRGARVPRWKLRAGLLLYDALALFRNVAPHRGLSARDVVEQEPHLRRSDLRGGARYYDAATDDVRLTLANALSAAESGAVVVNHTAVRALCRSDGGAAGSPVTGARVQDALTGDQWTVRARVIVNAAGPWGDRVRALEQPGTPPLVRGTKGVHVAVPRERVGNRDALTLLSPVDGRVMFVLPAGAQAIIGTTDTPTAAAPDDVRASEADVDYLLRSANAYFPEARLTRADVVSAWAGIRPLVASGYRDDGSVPAPASASREHLVERGPGGVIAVSGGKLTTYRSMAAEVVDAVERTLGRPRTPSRTAVLPLPGGDIRSLEAEIAEASAAAGDREVGERLAAAHGSRWREVWGLATAEPALGARLVPGLPYTGAELAYAAERELACTLADLLVRRTPLAFARADAGVGVAAAAAVLVAPRLGWDAARQAGEVERYRREAARLFGVDAAEVPAGREG